MLQTWVLALMLFLQPVAPWKDSYYQTATAIAQVAQAQPVYVGDAADVRTAALLVSLAWFESRFKVDAIDRDGRGSSIGLFQIERSNIAPELRDAVLWDPSVAAREAVRLIAESFRMCQRVPAEFRLGWYAKGGNGCRETRESKYRMGLAARLFRDHPMQEFAD